MSDGRTCKHRDHTQDDFLDTLDGAPALGRLLVHRGIVARRVQDGDTHSAVRINFRICQEAAERRKEEARRRSTS